MHASSQVHFGESCAVLALFILALAWKAWKSMNLKNPSKPKAAREADMPLPFG